MKASFCITLRIVRTLLHIHMSVNMLYSQADYLEYFSYVLIMLLVSISFLGIHLTPVTTFGQLLSDDLMLFLFLEILNLQQTMDFFSGGG